MSGGKLMSWSSLVVSYLTSILLASLICKLCSRIFKDVHKHPKQICCYLLQLGIPNESEPAPRAALHGSHWSQTSEQQEMVELMNAWAIEVGEQIQAPQLKSSHCTVSIRWDWERGEHRSEHFRYKYQSIILKYCHRKLGFHRSKHVED